MQFTNVNLRLITTMLIYKLKFLDIMEKKRFNGKFVLLREESARQCAFALIDEWKSLSSVGRRMCASSVRDILCELGFSCYADGLK